MKPAILTDLTRCIGCSACVMACKEINGLPEGETDELSSDTWCAVSREGDHWVRRQCMHCLDPACVAVCPVGALHKTAEGPVVYDESRCIGCRYCMVGCPFGVPRYEWDNPLPRVQKCILCFEKRVSKGEQPACTAACPTGAIVFGDRDELILEAKERIAANAEGYVDHVYGETEAGGTSVLYLSSVPLESLGFNGGMRGGPYPRLTWDVLSKLPNVVSVGAVMLFGIWWITGRREAVQRVENEEMTLEQAMEQHPPLIQPPDRGGKS
jgi:formate dehydrogenase iron-sulfur subunit